MDATGYVIGGIDNDRTCEWTYISDNQNSTLDGQRARFLSYDMFPATHEYPKGQQDNLKAELSRLVPALPRTCRRRSAIVCDLRSLSIFHQIRST